MKVIIAGDREFTDYLLLYNWVHAVNKMWAISEVVSGGARGTDKMGERWAKEHGTPVKVFPADWKRYGNTAGPLRNAQMGDYGHALLAFVAPSSKGTVNMMKIMRDFGKPAVVIPVIP